MKTRTRDRSKVVIEAIIFLVLLCVGLIWVAPVPLLPAMMGYHKAGRGEISWVISIVPITMTVVAVPAGLLTAKVGAKKVFATGALLQSAGLLTPLCTGLPLLILTRAFFGAGVAMTFPVAGGIIAELFTRKELPLVNGLNMSSTVIGNAVSLFASVPMATLFSWQMPMTLYAGLSFIFGLLWLLLGKDKDREEKVVLTEEKPSPLVSVLKKKEALILAASLVGPFCLFMGISSWLPTYYNQVFGIPLSTASSLTAILSLTGIPACLLGGILPSWLGLRKPFLLAPGILLGLSAIGSFTFNNTAVIVMSVALMGFFNQVFMPVVFTIPMELPGMTAHTGAIVIAVAVAVGNVGGFFGPLIVGYLADITGSYAPGFITCCILSLSLFFGGLLLPETGPKAKREPHD